LHLGHEDRFLPLRLSARSVIRKQTVAATRGNERDARIPAVRLVTSNRRARTIVCWSFDDLVSALCSGCGTVRWNALAVFSLMTSLHA
jgi:hypothetical protein